MPEKTTAVTTLTPACLRPRREPSSPAKDTRVRTSIRGDGKSTQVCLDRHCVLAVRVYLFVCGGGRIVKLSFEVRRKARSERTRCSFRFYSCCLRRQLHHYVRSGRKREAPAAVDVISPASSYPGKIRTGETTKRKLCLQKNRGRTKARRRFGFPQQAVLDRRTPD